MESIKIDQKAVQKEKEVHRKLENVKKDHERRLQELVEHQRENEERGRLIGGCCEGVLGCVMRECVVYRYGCMCMYVCEKEKERERE